MEPVTRWFAHPDGRVLSRSLTHVSGQLPTDPDAPAVVALHVPARFVEITAQEAAERLAGIAAANAEQDAKDAGLALVQADSDHQALIQAGIPDGLARRLAGLDRARALAGQLTEQAVERRLTAHAIETETETETERATS